MGLKDSMKGNPVKKVKKELATEAREQAGEAGAKAHASPQRAFKPRRGRLLLAGAGAGAILERTQAERTMISSNGSSDTAALHESGAISDEEYAGSQAQDAERLILVQ